MTYQVTAFCLDGPPQDGVTGAQPWMAVATAHVFDRHVEVKGLTPAGVILSGEAMRIISGKASAASEAGAVVAAVQALLFQLDAQGFIDGGNPSARAPNGLKWTEKSRILTQRRKGAEAQGRKKEIRFFAPLRLRAFALKSGHFNLFGALAPVDGQAG